LWGGRFRRGVPPRTAAAHRLPTLHCIQPSQIKKKKKKKKKGNGEELWKDSFVEILILLLRNRAQMIIE